MATERTESLKIVRDDLKKLEKRLISNLQLKDIHYDCAWNVEHLRGCLKSLDHLHKMHTTELNCLRGKRIEYAVVDDFLHKFTHFIAILGRTVVFARTSGVSLDGHVMLSTEDVQHNWLDVGWTFIQYAMSVYFEFIHRNTHLCLICSILVFQKYSTTR